MSEKIKSWPGTPIGEKEIKEKRILVTEWQPNLKYAWDTGAGYGRYFAELKKGKIVGTRCNQCRRFSCLPACSVSGVSELPMSGCI